jgi:hypothetical protein
MTIYFVSYYWTRLLASHWFVFGLRVNRSFEGGPKKRNVGLVDPHDLGALYKDDPPLNRR